MKPGNPPAKLQERCQFRRSIPQDEGEEAMMLEPLYRGFFNALRIGTLPDKLRLITLKRTSKRHGRLQRVDDAEKSMPHQR